MIAMGGPLERQEQVSHLTRQIHSIRRGAEYWRRRGRFDTAAELERVAAFVETTVENLRRTVDLLRRRSAG